MTTSGSDPNSKPGDDQDPSGSSGAAGQPTGWERPADSGSSAESGPPGSSPSGSSAADWPTYPPNSGGEPTRPLPPDQPYSAGTPTSQTPSQPYGDQPPPAPYAAPYQPYDPQAMPGYGSSTSYPSADAPQQGYPSSAPSGGGYGNPYEVNPYAQGQYGGYVGYGPPPNHPKAITAFVLGLVGVAVCTPVGIAGLVMGQRVRREIDAAPGQYSGRGLATAGWVLGIISVVILVLAVVFAIIGFTAGAMGS